MKKYILFYLLFCLSVGGWAKDFVHPGILHSSEALRRIAGLVKNDVNPSMGSFNKLKAEPEASYHYCIQGPSVGVVNTDILNLLVRMTLTQLIIMLSCGILRKIGGMLIKQWKLSGIMQQH